MFNLINFTTQLAGIARQNLPIARGVEMLAADARGRPRKMLLTLRDHLYQGLSLSEAMYLQPRYFLEDYVSMVRAGERSGKLAEVLGQLKKPLGFVHSILRKTLIYLLFYWCSGTVIILGISHYILPRFNEIFSEFKEIGFELAQPEFLSLKVWQIVMVSGLILLLFCVLLILYAILPMLFRFSSRPLQRFFNDCLGLFGWVMPFAHRIEKNAFLWRLSLSSSLFLGAGFTLPETLEECSQISTNFIFRRKLVRVKNLVEGGTSFSGALKTVGGFPHLFIQEVAAAERSGDLPQALARLGQEAGEKTTHYLRVLADATHPIFTLLFGALVAYLAVWLMYNLTQLALSLL